MSFNDPRVDAGRKYRHVYILESRDWWERCSGAFDVREDVLFTYDFALKREVERLGGTAHYFDHLIDSATMEQDNLLTYEFFRTWHLDRDGNDLFTFRGIPFGFSMRLDIWNDLLFLVRIRLCLQKILGLSFSGLFVGTRDGQLESTLGALNVSFTRVEAPAGATRPSYFFPIHRWMDEKVRSRKFRHRVKPALASLLGSLRTWIDRAAAGDARRGLFIQEYHPTQRLVQILKKDPTLRVTLAQYSGAPGIGKFFFERPVPLRGNAERFRNEAERLMRVFRERRAARLVMTRGLDLTESAFSVIERRVASQLAEILRTLDSVIEYLDRYPIRLAVMIANVGRLNTLVDCVCKVRGIRRFLIINGMLAHIYLDEGKYADIINAYSHSIRDHYFGGMTNIVCLGDPRMDAYALAPPRNIDRVAPTVTIGAAGFNSTNLNSYVAVEFEFLHDVLQALRILREQGRSLRIVITVRSNGYREQYEAFTAEYFPGLVDEILDTTPMRTVLGKTDFYISIYSQTLFEASCLGIPCLYYKRDSETGYPPFDEKSELVTVNTVDTLVEALTGFFTADDRFDAFLSRATMEKYVGFLDGENVKRNLQFIYELLNSPPPQAAP